MDIQLQSHSPRASSAPVPGWTLSPATCCAHGAQRYHNLTTKVLQNCHPVSWDGPAVIPCFLRFVSSWTKVQKNKSTFSSLLWPLILTWSLSHCMPSLACPTPMKMEWEFGSGSSLWNSFWAWVHLWQHCCGVWAPQTPLPQALPAAACPGIGLRSVAYFGAVCSLKWPTAMSDLLVSPSSFVQHLGSSVSRLLSLPKQRGRGTSLSTNFTFTHSCCCCNCSFANKCC